MYDQFIQYAAATLFLWVVVNGCLTWTRRFWPRDPNRLFNAQQKVAIHARAGYRCEHHWFGMLRCHQTRGLQADHIMPWSRGGPTTLDNAQSLCRRHNARKSNRIPSMVYRWRIRRTHRALSGS